MLFYLGVHRPAWLAQTTVPLFVSHRQLRGYKTPPRAVGRWSLDSGAFTEIQTNGRWLESPRSYAAAVRRYHDEVGGLNWAAIQDWMCEPFMLARTGLTVAAHQLLTVESLLELRAIAPDLPWAPVLQGWEPSDYLRHRDLYATEGVDLEKEPIVGVGSVCRRGKSEEIRVISRSLQPIKLHGFGVKTQAAALAVECFTSTDSMAWSFNARHNPPLPGHTHKNCANCLEFALRWRDRFINRIDTERLLA